MQKTSFLRHPAAVDADATISLALLGVRVQVRAHGTQADMLAAEVRRAWAWCAAEPSPEPSLTVHVLLDPDERIAQSAAQRGWVAGTSMEVVLHDLSPAITRRVIDHLAGSTLMFHACALAHPATGAAAVFIGPSGKGKTTLSRMLGGELGYVTDETVAVRDDGSLLLFPKPLSILQGRDHLKAQVCPGELGLVRPPARPQLAAVVLLDRRPDAPATPTLEPVQLLPAIAAIAEQVSYLKALDEPLQRLAELLRSVGGAQRLSYRDHADLLPVVRRLLQGAA